MEGTNEGVTFLGLNIIVIGAIGLLIFGYLVLLIRKRWRENFLHKVEEKKPASRHDEGSV
jgi:hypothetical protein